MKIEMGIGWVPDEDGPPGHIRSANPGEYAAEIDRLTKERDLALANADGVYAKLMPEVERLRTQLGAATCWNNTIIRMAGLEGSWVDGGVSVRQVADALRGNQQSQKVTDGPDPNYDEGFTAGWNAAAAVKNGDR